MFPFITLFIFETKKKLKQKPDSSFSNSIIVVDTFLSSIYIIYTFN
jgi:hypothetical protein